MEKVSTEQIELIEKHGVAVEKNASGKSLSTFLSGGKINYVIYPTTEDELKFVLSILSKSKYHFLGMGSNTLISDEGVNVILTTRRFKGYSLNGTTLRAKAGESVHSLAVLTANRGLGGMEFLFGIPGSVGGAVKMNAGAFGREIKDILTRVKLFKDGEEYYATPEDISLSYRNSDLQGAIVLECEFRLNEREPAECRKLMESYLDYRKKTQPSEPSLGSVFKKTDGVSSAKYIELLQMKGTKMGNAVLSEKHCNFIVNRKGATSTDYVNLMEKIKTKAKTELGVELEPEIKIIKD